MQKRCSEMDVQENNIQIFLRRTIEVSIDEIVSKKIETNPDLSSTELNNIVEDIMKTKDIDHITQKMYDSYQFCDVGKDNFILDFEKCKPDSYDDGNYENVLYNFVRGKSSDSKNKALNAILEYPLSDIIDERNWPKLSRILREYLISKNEELFLASFKTHVKLLFHPQSLNNGFTNITKALISFYHSKKGQTPFGDGLNLKNKSQEHVLKIISLLLKSLKYIHKNYNNGRQSMEFFITNFMELAIFHTYCDNNNNLHFLNYMALIDPKATWFYIFLYNTTNRNFIINFCKKNVLFLEYLITEVTSIKFNENELSRCSTKTEIKPELINIATFSVCANILCYLLCCKQAHELFPIKLETNDRPIYPHSLIISLITIANNLSNFSNQKQKRAILIDILKRIISANRHFLNNCDVTQVLLQPLQCNISEKTHLREITSKNLHIFYIMNEISNMNDGFLLLFGFTNDLKRKNTRKNNNTQYNRSISLPEKNITSVYMQKYLKQQQYAHSAREQDFVNPGPLIVDFTSNVLRYFVNTYESVTTYDLNIVYELLNCCYNIFSCHSHVMFLVNSRRLMSVIKDLYKVLVDRNLLIKTFNPLLKFLCLICGSTNGIDQLKDDPELFNMICKNFYCITDVSLWKQSNFRTFFINSANTKQGRKAISEHSKKLLSSYLNQVWNLEEDQLLFVSGSDRCTEEAAFEFLKIVFTISMNINSLQALLSVDSDDDSTLIDSDNKPLNLQELIEDTLNISGPGTLPCYLGLFSIRILIINPNILLFFNRTMNLQERLQTLQRECVNADEDYEQLQNNYVIIDECSLLRQDIINYIAQFGVVKQPTQNIFKIMNNQNLCRSVMPSAKKKRPNEFQRFLNDSRNSLHDNGWLAQTRKIYRALCGENLKECVLVDLIQQVKQAGPSTKHSFICPSNEKPLKLLFSEDLLGISMVVRFGINNNILQSSPLHEDNLSLLLKQVQGFLNKDRYCFDGFDWFVAVIFLICGGNIERSRNVLQCISSLPVGPYIWPVFGAQLNLQLKKDQSFQSHFDHALNLLIEDYEELNTALKVADISWNAVSRNWLDQCFFNVLKWSEVCHYLAVCILYPRDYVLFYIVSAARYQERRIVDATVSCDITAYQRILQLDGFSISDWLPYMEQMRLQYKNLLTKY